MQTMRLIGLLVLSSAATWAVACGASIDDDGSQTSANPFVGDSGYGASLHYDEAGDIIQVPVYRNPDGSPNTQIRCGSTVCDSTEQECCVGTDNDTMNPRTTLTCVPKGACANGSAFSMSCSSSANCPVGDVCCGTWQTGAPIVQVDCQASCDGPTDRRFCATDNECGPDQYCVQAAFDWCSGDAGTPSYTVQ